MVLTNKVAYLGGALLAVAAAVITYLYTQGILGLAWTTGIVAVIPFVAVFGIQVLTPAQIAQKIPAQVAAGIGTGLSGVNVLIVHLHIPGWVQIVVSAIDTAAGAVGIVVTGVAVSKAAQSILAQRPRALDGQGDWGLSLGALFWLVIVPLSPLIIAFDWVMRHVFGDKSYG